MPIGQGSALGASEGGVVWGKGYVCPMGIGPNPFRVTLKGFGGVGLGVIDFCVTIFTLSI